MGMDVWALAPDEFVTALPEIPEERYFRDSYNRLSLANWIARNIDPDARGAWGLAIFTQPRHPLNSPEWRKDLLLATARWRDAAQELRGKATKAGYLGDEIVHLAPDETDTYIDDCEELADFAHLVVAEGLNVEVWT